jgi:hypothetical protein
VVQGQRLPHADRSRRSFASDGNEAKMWLTDPDHLGPDRKACFPTHVLSTVI